MIRKQLFIAVVLLVGVAIGYVFKPEPSVAETDKVKKPKSTAATKIADRSVDAGREALRRRVAELEKLLAEVTAALAKTSQVASVEMKEPKGERPDGRHHGPPSAKGMREHMEQLKANDPKKYEEIVTRMAKWRQRRLDRANRQLDFLSSVDTSAMSEEQKETHEQYQGLIARREELEQTLHSEELSDEDRDAAFKAMFETERQMRQIARQERETLLDQTVRALGFSDDDVKTVSDTIREVISTTENGHGSQPPPPPPQE